MSLGQKTSHTSSPCLDEILLASIRQRDEAALAAFYSRHASRIYSVALRVLRDPSSAEDVLQEIFLQIWRSPTDFVATRGGLEAWLAVVTRNRAIDVIRRRRPLTPIDGLPLPSRQDLAAEVEHEVTLEHVKQGIATLPPRTAKSGGDGLHPRADAQGDRRGDRGPAGDSEDAHPRRAPDAPKELQAGAGAGRPDSMEQRPGREQTRPPPPLTLERSFEKAAFG